MSRTYDALKKAERQQYSAPRRPAAASSVHGRHAPNIRWDFDGFARLEYERLGVLVKTPARGKLLRTLAVVGCRAGSGATTTAALMAATLASNRRSRILLVDANLHAPSLDLVFATSNKTGLTEVLTDDKPVDACIQATSQDNIFVLTSGRVSAHPAAVFDRAAIEPFLEHVTSIFDFVIFDAAPVLDFPATCALVPCLDGVILVLHADRTSIDDARRARTELDRVNAPMIGAVLNGHQDPTPSLIRRVIPRS